MNLHSLVTLAVLSTNRVSFGDIFWKTTLRIEVLPLLKYFYIIFVLNDILAKYDNKASYW